MSARSSSNIAECVAASSLHEHQNVTKSSIGSAMANRFRRRPTSLHIPIPEQGSGTNDTNPSKLIKTSSNEHHDDASTGGGCSSSSSISSIPASSKAVAAALAGLTPSSSWYNSNGSDSECQSSLRTASRCDSQPLGRVSLSPSPCFGRRPAAIGLLSPLLNAATRAIGSDMEVFQLTTVNPVKSSTTSMYYSSDLNLNIQIGDQDEIELVGRKGLVGQHTHLPRSHQLHRNTNNINRHSRHDSISHNHMQPHLSSAKANPYIIQNQQYTQNYQHQHPPHQQSHYNGSNQFEQQQPHTLQPPHQQQQQNTNFIHSVSSSQQHQPHRGDNGLSASVVRRQKRPTTTVADDEDAGLRRISYIKATKEDRIQAGIDSDDFEDEIILGIEHDYDINNSGEFGLPVSSSSSSQQHKQHKSEVGDGTKPVTAHSIQRIRALFDREKSDPQQQSHQPHHYIYPYHPSSIPTSSGSMQMKPGVVSGGHSDTNEPQYYSQIGAGDRGHDFTAESQVSGNDAPAAPDSIKEGWLNCKISNIDGKKSVDRSWKYFYTVLKSAAIYLYKDKRSAAEQPMAWEEAPLRMDDSKVEIADDYTKRKCVFRLKTSSGSECLFQAESDAALNHWVSLIEDTLRHQLQPIQYNTYNPKTSTHNHYQYGHFPGGSAAASPNVYANRTNDSRQEKEHLASNDNETSNIHFSPTATDEREETLKGGLGATTATATSSKTDRKLTIGSRNRSPTGSSPKEKSRKASADQAPITKEKDKEPKKKWTVQIAKQWKKMQPGSSNMPAPLYPEGGSIGVPIEECPTLETLDQDGIPNLTLSSTSDMENVPLLVKICTSIVEQKGLEIVGMYRIPGNNAAVTYLTDMVNKGPDQVEEWSKLEDHRWNDVNVVSSLLKSFFRKLPDPLFTLSLYQVFIDASNIEDSSLRLNTLRHLVKNKLPIAHRETLQAMVQHLCKVAENSDTNKMDLRNLAIVFGPTLVRTSDDNMLSMINDMSHQCKIVESVLSNCEWFFKDDSELIGEDGLPIVIPEDNMDFEPLGLTSCDGNNSTTTPNNRALIANLEKLEKSGHLPPSSGNLGGLSSPSKDVSAKDIVSGIISAAKRKKAASTGHGSGKGSKKDSLDGEVSKSSHKHLDVDSIHLMSKSQSVPPNHPSNTSRRNSESVLHLQSAMAIAAAVPQLVVGSPHAGGAHHINPQIQQLQQQQQNLSQNLEFSSNTTSSNIPSSPYHNFPPQVSGNSSSTIISESTTHHSTSYTSSMTSTDNSGYEQRNKSGPNGDGTKGTEKGDGTKYPIETYQGLEAATAERIKRFEDETKAMLMRNSRSDLTPATPEMGRTTSESRMESWGNDLAGGILLQEPYQTKAYQQEIMPPQGTPNRFVNLTYLSPSKQAPGIGLQDQSNYGGNIGVSNSPHHQLLSPQNQSLPRPNVPHSFSRGITMPSLNAQEAYAAAMAGFDTHKIAGHGTLKRLQNQPHGYVSPVLRKSPNNNALQHAPPHLQKSHTDGQLKLRTTRNDEGEEYGDAGRVGMMGANSFSSIDGGTERSLGMMKHGSSEKVLGHQGDSLVKRETAESENLLSNLTASFDEKLRLLLDPHYQSTNGGNKQQNISASVISGNKTKPLSTQSTPIKSSGINHGAFARLSSPGIGRRVSDSVSSIIKSFNNESPSSQTETPPKPHRSLSLGGNNHSSTLSNIDHSSPTRNIMTPLTAREQNEVMNQEHQKVLRKSELKRGKLVDKNKEPPLLNHNRHGLRRNNSLTKDEKHQLNSCRKRHGDLKEVSNVDEKNNINNTNSEEKENIWEGAGDQQSNILQMVVQASTDPVGASKYRKTLANQRKIKRRHTVGGTKDFAEWEEIYSNQTNNTFEEDDSSNDTENYAENQRQYALQAINNCTVDEAATVAAFAAASRIIDRQKRQKKQQHPEEMISHGGYNIPATSSMAYRHQQPLLLHSSHRESVANYHLQRLKHGQSSPDLIFLGTSGMYPPTQALPKSNTNIAPESRMRQHPVGMRYSASSMNSPKRCTKETLLDRRLSLPDSVMNIDLQIAPHASVLQNQAFPEHASQTGRHSGSGSINEEDRRQSTFSPSLLESQV